MQDVTISNHNISCLARDGKAKYLPNGASYFISMTKKGLQGGFYELGEEIDRDYNRTRSRT